MEVDSPFPSFVKGKAKISPIPRRLFFDGEESTDQEVCKEKLAAVQRRLSFDHDILPIIYQSSVSHSALDNTCINEVNMLKGKFCDDSPPYKRIKSLRVFDSSTPFNGGRTPPSKDTSSSIIATPRLDSRICKFKSCATLNSSVLSRSLNAAPVNPFTPNGRIVITESIKRKEKHRQAFHEWLSGSFCDDDLVQNSSKNSSDCGADAFNKAAATSLCDLEISRFAEEFKVESFIASGHFGSVYKCQNYLDGMEYAVKKSAAAVAGTKDEHLARKEVFALAALKPYPHIITYFSSWIEDGHLFIQTEYCNGGTLEKLVHEGKKIYTDCGLRRLANHIAKGLKYIHSLRLAHMDIKPSNILICKNSCTLSSDEELDEVDKEDIDLVYKIGDLGHVISVDEPYDIVDGDCRYIPRELLNEDYKCLQKADVFSFGMTLYETAGGGPLPKNGDEWQRLRNGEVPYLKKYCSNFNQTLKNMLHPDPDKRPTARSILLRTRVKSELLQQQIFSWKVKNEFYQQAKDPVSMIDNSSRVSCNESLPKILVEHV